MIGDSPSLPQSGKEPQYSHFAALSDLNLRSGELATIPNRKNVAIRSDFLFLGLMGRPQDGAGGWATRPLARLQAYALV